MENLNLIKQKLIAVSNETAVNAITPHRMADPIVGIVTAMQEEKQRVDDAFEAEKERVDGELQTERQRVDAKFIEEKERVDTRLEAIEERDIDITMNEYEQLVEEGRVDPTKNYYISED